MARDPVKNIVRCRCALRAVVALLAILCVIGTAGCQSERKTTLVAVGTSCSVTDVWRENPAHPLVMVTVDPQCELANGTELITHNPTGDAVMTVGHVMHDMVACRLQRGDYPAAGSRIYVSEAEK